MSANENPERMRSGFQRNYRAASSAMMAELGDYNGG
jgi:hypothetical protein